MLFITFMNALRRDALLYKLGSFLPSAIILFVLLPKFLARAEQRDAIPHYIDNQLPYIMDIQESMLGIQYTTTPRISYGWTWKNVLDPSISLLYRAAEYDPETETIHYYSFTSYYDEPTLANKILRIYDYRNWSSVDGIVAHELGHHYVNQVARELNDMRWTFKEAFEDLTYPQKNGMSLVSEGIAEYFHYSYLYKLQKNPESSQEPEPDNFFNCVEFTFVRPIIDTYGDAGIRYLIAHPPVIESLDKLDAYQNELMTEIRDN